MNILLGPPGTGKTTKLLSIMDEALESGIRPEKIAFISFTRRAIREAKERVSRKFNIDKSKLTNFRTLHSFAFHNVGINRKSLMEESHYTQLALELGIELTQKTGTVDSDITLGVYPGDVSGDRGIFLDTVSRNAMIPLKEAWEMYPNDDTDFQEMERIQEGLKQYKQKYSVFDYTDLLEVFLRDELYLDLSLLLIDEAQDLTKLQWKCVERISGMSATTYVAGDDDQAIFKWSGADISYFIDLPGKVEVLNHSYRLPDKVHSYATNMLIDIKNRRKKVFNSSGEVGTVEYIYDLDNVDLSTGGTWLILARTQFDLLNYFEYLRNSSIYFSFRDIGPNKSMFGRAIQSFIRLQKGEQIPSKDFNSMKIFSSYELDLKMRWTDYFDQLPFEHLRYYNELEENGVDLLLPPRVQLSTIHGAKGTEADNVVVCPDMTWKTYQEMMDRPEDEARLFYVAVTRAKKNLYLLTPKRKYYYEL